LGAPTAVTRLWLGIFAGPTAWILQLIVSYPLAQLSCRSGFRSQQQLPLQLIACAALMIIGFGAVTAWSALQAVPVTASTDGGRPIDRARFMAMLGLLTSVLFTLVVIATAIPSWILHACE
jgi:hypothetical protein